MQRYWKAHACNLQPLNDSAHPINSIITPPPLHAPLVTCIEWCRTRSGGHHSLHQWCAACIASQWPSQLGAADVLRHWRH
jgi:hypothetical protein